MPLRMLLCGRDAGRTRRAVHASASATASLAALTALLAVLTVLLAGLPSPASAATACPADQTQLSALGAMSSGQTSCWKPFVSTSPFNTVLPANPKPAADNATVQQHIAAYGWHVEDAATSFTISAPERTRAVYFAKPSDPVMTIGCTAEYGPTSCQGANRVSANGARLHVPAGAQPASNADGHMSVIETDTGTEYDLYQASVSGSTITAETAAVFNADTSDGTGDGGDAANLALTGGLLRPSELLAGHIDHALAISIPCVNANGPTVGYVWPASGGWGEPCGEYWSETASTAPPIGSLFKLNMSDAEIAGSGAPAWEQTVMTALAHYGAYAEDTNGSWHDEGMAIAMQDSGSFTSIGQADQWASTVTALGGSNGVLASSVPIPTGRLEVVDPCNVRGTCPAATPSASPTSTPTRVPTTATPTAPAIPTSPVTTAGNTARAAPGASGKGPANTQRTARPPRRVRFFRFVSRRSKWHGRPPPTRSHGQRSEYGGWDSNPHVPKDNAF
jgi:hypothetical protein